MSDIQTSAEVSELYGAWAAAQAEITAVDQNRTVEVRMKTGGKYSYSYATLAQILHTIREPLTKNGLWYTQYVRAGEMITRVFHKSGEWMETGVIPMPDIKGAPADIGGIISFFKRYSLSEAMGLATEEDNSAEQGDDRQVSFRAKGAPKQADHQVGGADVEEPPMGWGDWSRGLLEAVKTRETLDELMGLQQTNWPYIDRLRHVDKMMFDDLSNAFKAKRAALDPKQGF